MARTAAKLEKELSRLEEIRTRLAAEEADGARERADASADMVRAMAADDPAAVDEAEARAKVAEGKLAAAARRRDAVARVIDLTRDELDAVRSGDALRASQRMHASGETTFEDARRQLFEALKTASAALGTMHRSYRQAHAAADEIAALGEERPPLYAYSVKESTLHLSELHREAVRAACEAAQISSPEFTWRTEIPAA